MNRRTRARPGSLARVPTNRREGAAHAHRERSKLDFRDVLIRPKRSTLGSRAEVDVFRSFRFAHTGRDWTGFPLIAANMDVVGTMQMARALFRHGAMVRCTSITAPTS